MRIQCLQHVQFETPGAIEKWASDNGHVCSTVRLYAGHELPSVDAWDWLVILGGPMSVHDESEHPWLIEEKRYIREALDTGKTVIGICLGAQLIADVSGARVYPNEQKEIGWFPVQWTTIGQTLLPFESFPAAPVVFHWHGETFELPEGAALLASSEACRNQAFVLNGTVFGFQFHLEMMEDNVRAIVSNCGQEIIEAPYIQQADEMLGASETMAESNALLVRFLDGLVRMNHS
jgi:GMP synthase-like glutamine amidotransferase